MNRAIAGPSTYVPSRTAARPRPRGSAHTSRRRALTVRLAEDAVGAVWVVEGSRAETPGEAGFAEDFYFDLGGSTPAPVKGIRFNTGSTPVTVTIPRPLGIVFEEKLDGIYTTIVVDEVVEGSNAARADVQVGDVLRITSAVFNVPGVVDVTAWLNPPKSTNCKAYFVADKQSFDKVMSAIQSHVVQVDTPDGPIDVGEVGLVLERKGAA
mmetsp:Transcript_20038/g.49860  ORF Transcript_20038/g.49860 Transcript_20038/m.49860 type:complete len:210 (-) Transcript_20038:418-1047(-)